MKKFKYTRTWQPAHPAMYIKTEKKQVIVNVQHSLLSMYKNSKLTKGMSSSDVDIDLLGDSTSFFTLEILKKAVNI